MIEVEHDMRQECTVMPGGDNAHRGHVRHAGAVADIFGHPSIGCRSDLRGARLQFRSCPLFRFADASLLVVGQDRDNDLGVDRAALVRNRCARAAASCASGGTTSGAPSKHSRSPKRTLLSTMERSSI